MRVNALHAPLRHTETIDPAPTPGFLRISPHGLDTHDHRLLILIWLHITFFHLHRSLLYYLLFYFWLLDLRFVHSNRACSCGYRQFVCFPNLFDAFPPPSHREPVKVLRLLKSEKSALTSGELVY